MLTKVLRIVYGLLGVLYLFIGVGSFVLPLGWLPEGIGGALLTEESPSVFLGHLLQEFGTVVLALGLLFVWHARRKELSVGFHWLVTLYLSLDALVHWVGPEGLIGSWPRGIINSVPFTLMLVLGLLWRRSAKASQLPIAG